MRYNLLILSAFIIFLSCGNKDVRTLTYDELAPLLHKEDDKTYVVNFWATWCKPCVDELPYFEKVNKDLKHKNVEVLLVSLDFPNQIEQELVPFIKKNRLTSKVVVLDDPNQNKWINAIDPSWSGSIPATIIYNKEHKQFYEQSFNQEELLKEIHKFIK